MSARRRAEAELYHNAYHDSLTQLSNRVHFDEQLNRAIARVQRHPEQRFAVMYLDFDRFKMVNDSLGHKAGDELLVNVAKRLKAMLRETDVLARLGGDEFAILVEDLHRQRDAVDLAERIHKELQKPILSGLHGSRHQRQHRHHLQHQQLPDLRPDHARRRHRHVQGEVEGQGAVRALRLEPARATSPRSSSSRTSCARRSARARSTSTTSRSAR